MMRGGEKPEGRGNYPDDLAVDDGECRLRGSSDESRQTAGEEVGPLGGIEAHDTTHEGLSGPVVRRPRGPVVRRRLGRMVRRLFADLLVRGPSERIRHLLFQHLATSTGAHACVRTCARACARMY